MRVVVCLRERIDPVAARALARLLFASEPPADPIPNLELEGREPGRGGVKDQPGHPSATRRVGPGEPGAVGPQRP